MDDPAAFFDALAPTLDARYGDYDAATAFYGDLARDAAGPALEVGVGTGGIYLDLLADGLDVDGIDVSAGMLDYLRERASDRGLDPDVWVADVTSADLDREYGLVYVPDRVFNGLATLADQRAALRTIRDALAPGGRLALNTFVPDFETVVEDYGEPEIEAVYVDGRTHEVRSTATLHDAVEQVARYRIEVRRDGETVAERATPLALIPKRQYECLFDLAGFEDWTVYGGFDREPLESVEQEMVWVVEG